MIDYSNIQLTEAEGATEPVKLEDVKAWLNIDFADDDELLGSMITGTRCSISHYTNLALIKTGVKVDVSVSLDREKIVLPYALKVVEDSLVVKDLDTDEVLAADEYTARGNYVQINYKGNYELSYDINPDVPFGLKEAIKMEVAERYANRGENVKEYASSVNGLSGPALQKAAPFVQVWL